MLPQIVMPELFYGFVAPIGADMTLPISSFRNCLESAGYQVFEIKVTDVFEVLKNYIEPPEELKTFPLNERYSSYIAYGNFLREKLAEDSILAAFSIFSIIRKRQKLPKSPEDHYTKTAYLIHQFKRKEEIELLRNLYGKLFFQVSIYSRRGARVDYLSRNFASSNDTFGASNYRSEAEKIIKTDEDQEGTDHGQKVSSIFHDADFILNVDLEKTDIEYQVGRFIDLIFSSNKHSPTKMEYGMFAAKSAALRTLDLSRQVGAAIFSNHGEIISAGSNEVPKALGGTYWSDDCFDDREWVRGYDSNDKRKSALLSDLLKRVVKPPKIEEFINDPNVQKAQFLDALEYGRIIHAEMGAICDAARVGAALKMAKLYVTTFPCHMCAKHIVAAGIAEVIFLEPYPKSLTEELHSDSVEIEKNDRGRYSEFESVKFLHFFGVTPRRYREIFERGKRKNSQGEFEEFTKNKKSPIISIGFPFYEKFEELLVRAVKEKLISEVNFDHHTVENLQI